MKIAVITLPLHTNYGGILQAYALQRVLEGYGHEVQLVRFKKNTAYRIYHPISVWCKQKGLIPYNHDYPLTARQHKVVRTNTDRFIGKNIEVTEPLSGKELALSGFDAFIVGSDQVWRHYDPKYFLGFLPAGDKVRRISYAASFGIGQWPFTPQQTARLKPLAARFDALSVREDSAVELCRKYMGQGAEVVLDPTMLLDTEHYTELADRYIGHPGSATAMTYILDRDETKNDMISKLCAELSLRENPACYHSKPAWGVPMEDCVWPPVEEWIAGFINARYVVTDSYHGTVFAILFNKPFITICNEGRGATRFHSLLKMFGLESRLINRGEDFDVDKINGKIDYGTVNRILADQRTRSLEFLQKNLL